MDALRTLALIVVFEVVMLALAFLAASEPKQAWVFLGTANQLAGVVLVALPDLLSRALAKFFVEVPGRIRRLPRQAKQRYQYIQRRLTWWLNRIRLQVKSRFRQVFMGKRDIIITPDPARVIVTAFAPTVTVTGSGTLEERVGRMENTLASLPGQMREEMYALRESRASLRWSGVVLVLKGTLFLGYGTW
jgi:hypothetical protein